MTDEEVKTILARLQKAYIDAESARFQVGYMERQLKDAGITFKMTTVGASWRRAPRDATGESK